MHLTVHTGIQGSGSRCLIISRNEIQFRSKKLNSNRHVGRITIVLINDLYSRTYSIEHFMNTWSTLNFVYFCSHSMSVCFCCSCFCFLDKAWSIKATKVVHKLSSLQCAKREIANERERQREREREKKTGNEQHERKSKWKNEIASKSSQMRFINLLISYFVLSGANALHCHIVWIYESHHNL